MRQKEREKQTENGEKKEKMNKREEGEKKKWHFASRETSRMKDCSDEEG